MGCDPGDMLLRAVQGLRRVVWVALIERIVRSAWDSLGGRGEHVTYEGKRPNGRLEHLWITSDTDRLE